MLPGTVMCSPCVLLPFRHWPHRTITRNPPDAVYFRMFIEIGDLIGKLGWGNNLITGQRLDELSSGNLVGVIRPMRNAFVLLEAVVDKSLIVE